MLDQFNAPQMQRIDREATERGNLRTAEAWLADQDARLSLAKPRPQPWDWVLVLEEARSFLIFFAAAFVMFYVFLSIGGM